MLPERRNTVGRFTCKVLSYHRVLPADLLSGQLTQRSLLVPAESFRRHMMYIRKNYRVVTADELARALHSGKGFSQPSCAVTFDDGWRDNYLYAFPILKEFAIPATLFVAVNHIETGQDFWPERLARLLSSIESSNPNLDLLKEMLPIKANAHSTPAEFANLATISLKDKPLARIEQILAQLEAMPGLRRNHIRTERPISYWHELEEMIESGLVTVGSHTLSHVILPREDDKVRTEEVVRSREIIEEKLRRPVLHFAYPNGEFDDATESLVKDSGYRSAFTCLNGVNGATTSPYRIRRIHIFDPQDTGQNGFSEIQFSIRISNCYQYIKRCRNLLTRRRY
ncbi:MAG: polysaccharide deacetylase family protein [Candidatus Abyssobacteria bacterium SURF_5]|uniref:Polysaccharide deacetylase family protein n=1 Tax=Abyssobacteria bacterium (strain SURF_5) TaxID=2093360 RepID=A0A3A4NIT1_ABYX5|nr:MAG: polysaccharide deacetylase family protein [Candidatus Abyssubacteria bacterium SURF_5]